MKLSWMLATTTMTTFLLAAATGFSVTKNIVLQGPPRFGSAVALSESGHLMVTTSHNSNNNNSTTTLYAYQLQKQPDNTEEWKLHGMLQDLPNYLTFDLSPDGTLLAVRHANDRVQLYDTTDASLPAFGTPLLLSHSKDHCPKHDGSILDLAERLLLVTCPSFDAGRGQVVVYTPTASYDWKEMIRWTGAASGDRLGAAAVLDDAAVTFYRLFRLAVLSAGRVQVWDLDLRLANGYDLRQALVPVGGSDAVEVVGTALAMSRGTRRAVLAVAAADNALVVLQEDETSGWTTVSEQEGSGSTNDEKTEETVVDVAMTPDATRVAVCSWHSPSHSGEVMVLERTQDNLYQEIAKFSTGREERYGGGYNVALSGSGSLVVSGASGLDEEPYDTVHTFLDQSPFCSLPLESDDEDFLYIFLARQVCREGKRIVETSEECAGLIADLGGVSYPCVWQTWPTSPPTQTPTASPTTLSPTAAPQSAAPAKASPTPMMPTIEPTAWPTALPSLAPTPSLTESSVDTPTLTPSEMTPTTAPHTQVPTTTPSITPREDNDLLEIDGCRCDEAGDCQEEPLPYGSPLHLCLALVGSAKNQASHILEFVRLSLVQGSSRVVIWDANDVSLIQRDASSYDQTTVDIECSSNDGCRVKIPTVPSFLFLYDRPSNHLNASGLVALVDEREPNRNLRAAQGSHRHLSTSTLTFNIKVPLELLPEGTDPGLEQPNITEDKEKSLLWVAWLLLAGVLISLAATCCFWRWRNKPSKDDSSFTTGELE